MVTYRRVATEDVPDDAVVVIFTRTDEGLRASVAWKPQGDDKPTLEPMSVEQALFEAQLKAIRLRARRVVVNLEDAADWNPDWGTLEDTPV